MKQKELSRWLRGIVIVCWAVCGVMAAFLVPMALWDVSAIDPAFTWLRWPCLSVFWLALVPVVIALYEAWLIFGQIGRDNSFCHENARRLRRISYLAAGDSALTFAVLAALIALGAINAGLFLLMLGILFFGVTAAVACAALSHLTEKAAALKDENDLTV